MDSGALEICLVMRENMFNIEFICFSFHFFFTSISDICLIEKCNKGNGQKQLLGLC